jgi:hypothetical protein
MSWTGAFILTGTAVVMAGCPIQPDQYPHSKETQTTLVACSADSDCDDGNPCTVDSCNTNCIFTADDSQTPSDDGNPCTTERCEGGKVAQEFLADASCDGGTGFCDPSSGKCASCADPDGDPTTDDFRCGGACPLCLNGTGCMDSSECGSGFCVDGVCCDEPCGETCKACNLNAALGTCKNLPMGSEDDAPVCSGNMTCNGGGDCLLKSGEACVANSECASDTCDKNTGSCQ